MATDERREEQDFLAELKARSGRDLAEWMAAIAARNFADKNETIDWLREQGFPFARASWLERIHSNGGRPIYDDKPERAVRPPPKPRPEVPPAAPTAAVAPAAPVAPPPSDAPLLEKLIAGAKGYRPLYMMLEAQMRAAVPGLALTPAAGHISLGAPAEFGAVTLHSTEVRLGLDLGDRPFEPPLQRAKLKGPGARITHMVVLTDARQLGPELMGLVFLANARVNG